MYDQYIYREICPYMYENHALAVASDSFPPRIQRGSPWDHRGILGFEAKTHVSEPKHTVLKLVLETLFYDFL